MRVMVRSFLPAVLPTMSILAASIVSAADVGTPVDSFVLQDYRGKEHQLSDYYQAEVVVIAFLGTECPLVKLYGPRLAAFANQFEPGEVAVIGINSNSHDSVTEIAAYARRHGIEFPILKDSGNKVADQLGAERTPEVFVLDGNRIVRYHGRIDDQYGVGYVKDEPVREDLKEAVRELLEGKPVSVASTKPVGCRIGRMKEADPNADVTYSNTIAHILQKRCVECHREGEIAPFALRDYDEVAGWAEMIQEVVHENRMPPWHADPEIGNFRNDRHLSDDEKSLIDRWVAAGAPEGDPADLPDPVEFVTGWQLPREPDFVMDIMEEPFVVPAEGEVKYQYFSIDPGFEEDKWVKAVEIQPGNRAVVHHILMFVLPKGSEREAFPGGATGYDGAYVPGLRTIPYPEGMAKRFPANSTLVFQVHYTPVGTDQEDISRVGLLFTDEDEVEYEVRSISAVNTELDIPPHDDNYRSEASSRRMRQDAKLIEMMAHMHLRGKAFRYEAVYPNGTRETLLDIPQYDFNWQTAYRLIEPLDLPKGTRIHCVAYFDNSEKNLANPNPNDTVRWGTQTWEEMLIGYFDIAIPKQNTETLTAYERRAEELVAQFDKNLDDIVGRREVPLKMQLIFATLDLDSNGELTVTEIAEAMEKYKDKFKRRRRQRDDHE